jgi:kynurenine formamidase
MDPAMLPSYAELLERTDAPPGSSWGLFGPDDQLGTLNLLSTQALATATAEVRDGAAYRLDLRTDLIAPPLAATRKPPEHHMFARNEFHRDEWLDCFYTQYGSQIDGLRHFGHPDYGFYNGTDPAQLQTGTDPLSIHHLAAAPIAGRAVLIDVARHLQDAQQPVDHAAGQPIPIEEVEAARAAQRTELRPGDIVLLRFGFLSHYRAAGPAERAALAVGRRHAGLLQSHDTLAWLWDHRVAMVAADNFALECWPAQPSSPFLTLAERRTGARDVFSGVLHRAIIPLLGMPIGELWDLDDLAAACVADRRYACLLTAAPLPLVGGVGSPANAIAIR